MKLSLEEVLHISMLCRMELTEEEIEKFRNQLSNVLENFEILQQVDTTDIPPMAYPIHLENITRDDEVAPSYPQSDILANAPRAEDGQFRVKAVLDSHE
ncbi:MAG: Asp-tRNA(Asn)/Glu-tRNA(Gln) amidotransferase subunit GatC [Chloroflexota bacterium]|nr:Asp-tRNA(Asn)/Glu-tRNA(Gln) amidotransferase subunit GatC [Chloroflexota bacterium]